MRESAKIFMNILNNEGTSAQNNVVLVNSGIAISTAAAALGISSLERHITLDRSMYGSDQSASVESAGLRQLVGAVRKCENAMGDGVKRVIADEAPIAKNLRQHLN